MIDCDKNKELSCHKYWDVNDLYGWEMPQTLPVNNLKWVNDISKYNSFIKSYNKESDKGYFFEVDVQYPEKLHELHKIYHFHLKE